MSTEPRVADFLAGLATDPDALARFTSSTEEAIRLMDAAGLAPDSQRALGSRDLTAVHEALKAESPGAIGLNAGPEMGAPPARDGKKKKKGGKKRPPAKPPGKPGGGRKPGGGKKPGSRKRTSRSAAPKRS
jgi:hypothetical protein